MNFIRRLLSSGSQTVPKVIDDLVEAGVKSADDIAESGLVKKVFTPDEIIGEAAKKATKATDISDAEEVLKRMDPKLSGLAKGAAATGIIGGGLASMFMGDDEPTVQVPLAKESEIIEQAQPEEEISSQEESVDIVQPIQPSIRSRQPSIDSEVKKESTPEMDELSLLQAAQDRDAQDRMMMGLLRASNQIGGALAMTRPDYSGVEALEKNVGINEANVKSRIATKANLQKINQAQREIDDEEKLRDPNSDASKTVKQILSRFGVNVRTAKQAKDLGINVQNILLQEMASADRMKMSELKMSQEAAKKEKKLSDDQKKFARDLRKEATGGVLGKQYATFATGQRMESALSQFAKDPSGYKDYATLMGGLKSLQGDESVVREAEVRLGMSATSLFDSLQNQLQKAATGKMLQPSQRAQMIDTIRILTDASKQQYMQSVQPILEQAQKEGIDRSLILPGSLVQEEPVAKESSSEFSPKQEAGIQAVMQKNGVSREQAISALRKAGKL